MTPRPAMLAALAEHLPAEIFDPQFADEVDHHMGEADMLVLA